MKCQFVSEFTYAKYDGYILLRKECRWLGTKLGTELEV